MLRYRILIVDDEQIVRNSLRRLLENDEREILLAADLSQAKKMIRQFMPDVMIVDYKLGDENGIDLLPFVREYHPEAMVIVLTAYGNIALAVDAIKKGAYDFLQKESDPALLRHVIDKALEKVHLRKEVELLQLSQANRQASGPIVYQSPAMKRVMALANEYAQSDCTVLLEGETGTGKSMIAEYIHYSSQRKDKPLITINCGAIPRELIESELFGYDAGAFTGARSQGKVGLIEQADGGTLFLDEISDLAVELQSKLLYVLEKGEFLRVGGVKPKKVEVRFLAATNANLQALLQERKFRQDLYYRLNVGNIRIPPLRERKEDILPLARMFIQYFNKKFHKSIEGFTPEAEAELLQYPWPGNIRELRNIVERVLLISKSPVIGKKELRFLVDAQPGGLDDRVCHLEIELGQCDNALNYAIRRIVEHAWELSQHNQSTAARLLGIPRTTLQNYLQKYRLV
ncbi:MAG: sigma-54 dependent transcriptional regulator [candidate division KSB1 bacterium]|nr:sigma-54 dependent transcriptional regulator [candidate division KSB1 bacterium]